MKAFIQIENALSSETAKSSSAILSGERSMTENVNMHKIAKMAGVSLGTVSNVINGSVPVSEKLRERVLDAVDKLGYQPSALARGLRRKASNMIGMIIPDITNPFFPAIVRGVEDITYRQTYQLVLGNSDNDPRKELWYLTQLRTFRPAGFIIIPAHSTKLLQQVTRSGPPFVFVDRCPDGWHGDSVMASNEQGAYEATKYLLGKGHRRVAAIIGPTDIGISLDRRAGFLRALKEARVAIASEYVQEGHFTRDSGYSCMLRLLSLVPRPTAVFTANDLMGVGAIEALREAGLRCPADVSICSFDNLDMAQFTEPSLTSVHQPGYQMGVTAAQLLLDRIAGSSSAPRNVVLPTELKVRNSVIPLPQRAERKRSRR